ncbi:MAG: hypothetical protein M0P16_00265 [Syntrophales bacterium]|jgi:hypothetical protein|nr:hypothetical protein [Syntrophales bacterium]
MVRYSKGRYNMIPVKNVTIERAEGPTKLCVTRTFPDREAASAWLQWQWNTFPADGHGYHKVFYTICYEDGHFYRGRLECKRHNVPDVRNDMVKHCLWMSGQEKAPHCGKEKYRLIMDRLDPNIIEQFRSFMDQYTVY